MPIQVQHPPQGDAFPRPHAHDAHHEHDPTRSNRNAQHREALRLALGSILTPKRPHTPSSRSSSGTASPAHPWAAGPASPPLPPPPHPTPAHARTPDVQMLAPPLAHSHSHPHTPSRLGISETHAGDYLAPTPTSSHASPALSAAGSQHASPRVASAPDLPTTDLPAPAPVFGHAGGRESHSPESGTPKAKFLETLQSKSAWEALIHGSFS